MEVYNELKFTSQNKLLGKQEITIRREGMDSIGLDNFHEICMDLAVCQGYHPDMVKQLFDYQTWEEEQKDDEDKTPL